MELHNYQHIRCHLPSASPIRSTRIVGPARSGSYAATAPCPTAVHPVVEVVGMRHGAGPSRQVPAGCGSAKTGTIERGVSLAQGRTAIRPCVVHKPESVQRSVSLPVEPPQVRSAPDLQIRCLAETPVFKSASVASSRAASVEDEGRFQPVLPSVQVAQFTASRGAGSVTVLTQPIPQRSSPTQNSTASQHASYANVLPPKTPSPYNAAGRYTWETPSSNGRTPSRRQSSVSRQSSNGQSPVQEESSASKVAQRLQLASSGRQMATPVAAWPNRDAVLLGVQEALSIAEDHLQYLKQDEPEVADLKRKVRQALDQANVALSASQPGSADKETASPSTLSLGDVTKLAGESSLSLDDGAKPLGDTASPWTQGSVCSPGTYKSFALRSPGELEASEAGLETPRQMYKANGVVLSEATSVLIDDFVYKVLPPVNKHEEVQSGDMYGGTVTLPAGWKVLSTEEPKFEKTIKELSKYGWGAHTLLVQTRRGNFSSYRTSLYNPAGQVLAPDSSIVLKKSHTCAKDSDETFTFAKTNTLSGRIVICCPAEL